MTKKVWLILLNLFIIGCIVLIGIGPIIPTAIAGSIANANGCQLDEGGVHPCVINGVDYGETLLTMGMSAWLAIATLPIAAGFFVLYLVIVIIVAIVSFFAKKRKMEGQDGNRLAT